MSGKKSASAMANSTTTIRNKKYIGVILISSHFATQFVAFF